MTVPRTALLCLVSALAAAGLAFAVSTATSGAHGKAGNGQAPKRAGLHKGAARGALRAVGGRAVHVDAVLAQADGTFAKATVDRGFVKSVSGDQLTVTQGTRKATYGETTITVPAGATIVVNRAKGSALSDLKAGQRVVVAQMPKRFTIVAADAKPAPKAKTTP
jgi:hypothetical protein